MLLQDKTKDELIIEIVSLRKLVGDLRFAAILRSQFESRHFDFPFTKGATMPQFETKQEVLRAYADLLDRHQAAGLEGLPPWTVADADVGDAYTTQPNFDRPPSAYVLPVAICDGQHVWLGSVLCTNDGAEVVITENTKHLVEDLDMCWSRPIRQRKTVKLLAFITTKSGMLVHFTAHSCAIVKEWRRVPSEDKEVEVL